MPAPESLRVALLQFNPVIGDLVGNAHLALAPELVLSGYPPEAMAHAGDLRSKSMRALRVRQDAVLAVGFERTDVERVTRPIKITESKCRQSPVGISVTHRGFGRDRSYPIAPRFRA